MEQNDTNKEKFSVPSKKKVPFLNRQSTRLLIVAGIVLITIGYFTVWVPRQECKIEVSYHPAGTVRTDHRIFDTEATPTFNQESYYEYSREKFKTIAEAISYCAQNK